MKKLIIITGLLTFTSIIYCQSFILENKTWNVVECMNFGACGTHSFKISGDTTIGQVDYKKLYSTYDTALINWSIYGAMRENENQVFIYNFYHESEELLYDFNLSVGDTFSTTVNTPDYNGCPIELIVTSIDTIILENGESKQRFNFMGEQWISGVGSLYGIIYVGVGQCIFDMYYDLSCCHENDELIFQSSIFDGCFVYTVGLNENYSQIKQLVFPNPSTSRFTIQFNLENKEQVKFLVLNSLGQVVATLANETLSTGQHELIWNADGMPAGVYFYNIQIGNQAGTGKLVLMK